MRDLFTQHTADLGEKGHSMSSCFVYRHNPFRQFFSIVRPSSLFLFLFGVVRGSSFGTPFRSTPPRASLFHNDWLSWEKSFVLEEFLVTLSSFLHPFLQDPYFQQKNRSIHTLFPAQSFIFGTFFYHLSNPGRSGGGSFYPWYRSDKEGSF